jgi:hypothetical protein
MHSSHSVLYLGVRNSYMCSCSLIVQSRDKSELNASHLLLRTCQIQTKFPQRKEIPYSWTQITTYLHIVLQIAFLFEKKVLNVSSLAEVDRPLREAIELLSKYYNARVRRFPRAFPVVETFARIEVYIYVLFNKKVVRNGFQRWLAMT